MAYGAPTVKLEVQWDGSTWVDESAYLRDVVTITRGDPGGTQPGTLTATLDNTSGRFTPDSPLSALWPDVADGARCRASVTRGGDTVARFIGRITVGAPEHGDYARAQVQVTAVDVLGDLARRTLESDVVEQWRIVDVDAVVDMWEMSGTATALDRLPASVGQASGWVVPAASRAGSAAHAATDGLLVPSCLQLQATDGIGPVIVLPTRVGSGLVTEVTVAFRTSDRVDAGAADKWILAGMDGIGDVTFSLRIKDTSGRTDLVVHVWDGVSTFGVLVGTIYQGWSPAGASGGDDQWFVFRATLNLALSTTTFRLVRVRDGQVVGTLTSATTGTEPMTRTRHLVLGARARAQTPGKQYAGPSSISFAAAAFSSTVPTTYVGASGQVPWLQPGYVVPAQTRLEDIAGYVGVTLSATGSRDRHTGRVQIAGRYALDVIAELARTAGAVVVASASTADALVMVDADELRQPTPALTVDLEDDAAASGGLPLRKGEVPTTATVTWPGGTVVVTDDTRDARSDVQVETCAADEQHARDVGAAVVHAPTRLRLAQVTVDLAGAATDLWDDLMALQIGDRVRVTVGTAGTPLVTQLGWTWLDAYVTAWAEQYGEGAASWVLELTPADPLDGVFDTARWSGTLTVTGGTAVGTTSNGTLVVEAALGDPVLSTAAGDYPLTLDWSGEYVTITSAPVSSTSPQTVTTTARGVAPSVARVHGTGEPVDAVAAVWAY